MLVCGSSFYGKGKGKGKVFLAPLKSATLSTLLGETGAIGPRKGTMISSFSSSSLAKEC